MLASGARICCGDDDRQALKHKRIENSGQPEVIVDPLESPLFLGQGSTPKYGFEVDPLALYLVEIVQELVQVGQARLPDGSFVLEALVVGRVLERLQQTLVVSYLQPNKKSYIKFVK